jgi:hypothetical protein
MRGIGITPGGLQQDMDSLESNEMNPEELPPGMEEQQTTGSTPETPPAQ